MLLGTCPRSTGQLPKVAQTAHGDVRSEGGPEFTQSRGLSVPRTSGVSMPAPLVYLLYPLTCEFVPWLHGTSGQTGGRKVCVSRVQARPLRGAEGGRSWHPRPLTLGQPSGGRSCRKWPSARRGLPQPWWGHRPCPLLLSMTSPGLLAGPTTAEYRKSSLAPTSPLGPCRPPARDPWHMRLLCSSAQLSSGVDSPQSFRPHHQSRVCVCGCIGEG